MVPAPTAMLKGGTQKFKLKSTPKGNTEKKKLKKIDETGHLYFLLDEMSLDDQNGVQRNGP